MTSFNYTLDHEAFYRELTLRNAGFISDADQGRLRKAGILVAGCGSTGGSAIELLVRTGAEHLLLADNGTYDLNNANRQNMTHQDVGRPKVDVFAERTLQINPYLDLDLFSQGVTPDNVDALVARADVVIDAVDVTGRAGLEMKYLLHCACQRQRKPVICGYDMAAAQYIPVFDYRRRNLPVLDGQLTAEQVASLDPIQACTFLIPIDCIPVEMFDELNRHRDGKDYTSQLGIAANLFGTIATALVLELANDRPVKSAIYQDVWDLVRDRSPSESSDRLNQGREALELWKQQVPDAVDTGFLERSLQNYRVPRLPQLLDYPSCLIGERGGILTFAIPHDIIAPDLARQLLRFAFVHYANVGFINAETAARCQLHAESPDNLSLEDVHIVLVAKGDNQLLGYSTLKAPIARGLTFGDISRPSFSVETAFGRDLYQDVITLKPVPVEEVREVGRVTKAPVEDPALAARVGICLLSAYRKLLTDPHAGITAVVGDGEANVTLRNLTSFGFKPTILPQRVPVIPSDHLFANRYQDREVRTFWLFTTRFDHPRADEIEALIDMEDDVLLARLKELKNNTPEQGA